MNKTVIACHIFRMHQQQIIIIAGADYRFQSGVDVFGASADGVCGTEPIHRQPRDDGGNGGFLSKVLRRQPSSSLHYRYQPEPKRSRRYRCPVHRYQTAGKRVRHIDGVGSDARGFVGLRIRYDSTIRRSKQVLQRLLYQFALPSGYRQSRPKRQAAERQLLRRPATLRYGQRFYDRFAQKTYRAQSRHV